MPGLGVDVVIIDRGRVLLTLREDFRVWCLPGGGVDPGESLAQAALREAREETGLEVELTRLVGVYSRPQWGGGGDHVIVFAARPLTQELKPDAGEVVEAAYYAFAELPEKLLWWQHYYIADAISGIEESVARSIKAIWPFDQNLSRPELYTMRDLGEISQEYISQLWKAPPGENQKLEVGGNKK